MPSYWVEVVLKFKYQHLEGKWYQISMPTFWGGILKFEYHPIRAGRYSNLNTMPSSTEAHKFNMFSNLTTEWCGTYIHGGTQFSLPCSHSHVAPVNICNQLDETRVADHGVVKRADHGATLLHPTVCYVVVCTRTMPRVWFGKSDLIPSCHHPND